MRLLRFAGRCVRSIGRLFLIFLPPLLVDAVGIAGASAVVTGTRMIHEPSGYIVAGVFMLTFAFLMARRAK